ncbi:DNA polymerase nu [Amphibalanus amphitrite]|uniref:DNA polymerase nu n=1 Tax=Amphibalanus amphitrite TaxID=1232801 RepID=A0A6A4WLN8_AMPAM|nr:DNA polymerase nu [Amphibalanus amphitrite]
MPTSARRRPNTVTSRPRESPDRQRARTATRHEGELTALLLAVSSGSAIASLTAECAEPLARALQEPTITCVCLCLEHDDGGSQLRPVTERRSGALLPGHAALVAAVVGGRLDGVTIRLRPDGMSTGAVSAVAAALLAGAGRRVCWGARELLLFMLRRCGVRAADGFRCWRLRDLTIADWLLEPDRPSRQFCQVLSELGAQSGTAARDAALSRQEQLAADLRQLAQLDTAMAQRLRTAGLLALFELVETPLATVLAAMEAHGVQVDVARLHAAAAACQRQLRCLEAAAQRAAGTVFSLSSSAQLRRLLYDELRLDARSGVSVPLTERGLKSTSEQALQRLLAAHPLPGLVIQHRRLLKFKSTYVEGVLAQVRGGGVFPQWLQTAAATGRVQAAAPNLQSVPKRPLALTTDGGDNDDRNAVLARSPFVARSGHTLLSMDFCQMELRLLAHLSRDACLMAAIRDAPSGDIFRQLAALWTGEPADAIDDAQRERTKRLVYAAMYGAGRHRLAEVLQCEPQQAQRALDSFLAQCPAIGAFSSQVVAECRRAGLVSSLLGRRRRVAAIMSSQHLARSQAERQAVNFVIQGSAADLCKLVMVAVAEAAPDVPLLAQLHDELLWEVPQGRLGEFRALVERQVGRLDALLVAAGHRQPLLVPLPVSIAAGVCWAHMEPLPPADRA